MSTHCKFFARSRLGKTFCKVQSFQRIPGHMEPAMLARVFLKPASQHGRWIRLWRNLEERVRKMWHSAQKLTWNMAEFFTVHVVSLENASRFFLERLLKSAILLWTYSWRLPKFSIIRQRSVTSIWVPKTSPFAPKGLLHLWLLRGVHRPLCNSNRALKAKSESGEIWRGAWEKCGVQHKIFGRIWQNLTQSRL